MSATRALLPVDDVGSLEWLERTLGTLTRRERSYLLRGMFAMIRDGFRLRRAALRSDRRNRALDLFEPPDTPMVAASRAYLDAHSGRPMANHSIRTAFWTSVVLDTHTELTPRILETTWVAALLHDVGLEQPPAAGDFSVGGVDVLKSLAHQYGWSEEQTHEAGEAIAINLSTRVDPTRVGLIAWAMNAGGAGELGIWPHRAQMHRTRITELEARYPRDNFRRVAMDLIRSESRRLPDGRFALFKPVYWLLMR